MQTSAERFTATLSPEDIVRVVPLTVVALQGKIVRPVLMDWLAGFGIDGAVGYDTNTDLILRVIPSGKAGADARGHLIDTLADTFHWLAADPQGANPPKGFTDNMIWEACVLAAHLGPAAQLADALVAFYHAALTRQQGFSGSLRCELTEALRINQPGNLHLRGMEEAQDLWQGLWLDFLTGKNLFLECFRDDAIWSLLAATFGQKKIQPLKPVVSDIRELSDGAYNESSTPSKMRYFSAFRAESSVRLSKMADDRVEAESRCVPA